MEQIYNPSYYHDDALHSLKPAMRAIKTFRTVDGIVIGMFQGKRGQIPELDFEVKILKPGIDQRPFPPIHSLWVVDLILKIQSFKEEVREIITFYIDFYNRIEPFNTVEERAVYTLQTVEYITTKYSKIEQAHTLSLEYVAIIIELFCINEKRNAGAYMFRNLLLKVKEYINGDADYIELLIASKPGFH
ncbi:MAG: hypothetical protein ABFC34_04580 [Methanobacterium sp.]